MSDGAPVDFEPDPADEGPHPPEDHPWWSESHYFDAVFLDGDEPGLGVYLRFGNVPQQPGSLVSVAVVRPGGEVLLLNDPAGPRPVFEGDGYQLDANTYRAGQQVVRPSEQVRVHFDGTVQTYADGAAVLRGEPSGERDLSLDLTWTTAGRGYQWQATTRYEFPCDVSGALTMGGKTLEVHGPGQRDHSWSARDWWSLVWCWSAFALDDGTRVHAVTLPALAPYAVGYLQRDGELTDIGEGRGTWDLDGDGLPTHTRLAVDQEVFGVEPIAFAPLVFTSTSGQVTHFVRALARFTADDGRTGHGWIEWNLVQPDPAVTQSVTQPEG